MMLVVLVFVSALSAVTARTCTKVNGISGACNLRLNQFTLAGTHNSGSGAFGLLYWWSGGQVPSCWYRNQDQSITGQLNLGIRYFDFDVAYIDYQYSDWWEKGIVLVHCGSSCAYSRSFRRAMDEIEAFLDKNQDEIIVIRMKDHPEWARDGIRNHLTSELSRFISGHPKVKMNDNPNPRLRDAIEQNKRLFVFANGGFHPQSPIHSLSQVESYTGAGGTAYCYSVSDIVDQLLGDDRTEVSYYAVQVDWFQSHGLCLWDLAGLCDGSELNKLITINKEIVKAANRPINLVMIDYAGYGNVRLADVVKKINNYNVKTFA